MSAQIIALLFGSLIVAQAATLCLTLVLPPAPAPQYGVDDIAAAIRGDFEHDNGARPLMRSISSEPPSSQSPGWLVSERSRHDLARMLGANEADVRLLFYTPLPFAGAATPPRPAEGEPPIEATTPPGKVEPAAWDWQSGEVRAGLIKTAYESGPPPMAGMSAGGPPLAGAFGDGDAVRRFPRASALGMRNGAPTRMGAPDRAGPVGALRNGPAGAGMIRRDRIGPDVGAMVTPSDRVERWVNPRNDRFASPDRTFGPLPQAAAGQTGGQSAVWSRRAAQVDGQGGAAARVERFTQAGATPSGLVRGLAAQGERPASAPPTLSARVIGPAAAGAALAAPSQIVSQAGPPASQSVAQAARRWTSPVRIRGTLVRDTAVATRQPQQDRTIARAPSLPRPAPSSIVETTTAAAVAVPVESPLQLAAQAPPGPLDRALPNLARPTEAAAAPAAATEGFEPAAPVARGLFGLAPAPLVQGDFVAAYREAPGRWIVVRPTPEPFPNSWQRRVLLWFALSLAVVAPVGYLFARSLTMPLTDFVKAAEHIGRDPSASVLVKEGPAEVGRAGRAFNQMQRRLKRFVDDRAAVVGALSHDLRAPLLRMRFRAEKAPPDVKAGMLHEVAQMEDMITSVLAFMRDVSESGPRESVDLRSVLECVIDDVALTGGKAVLDPGEDVLVEADVQGVRRALTNLVENAVKYGESARARLFVEAGEAVVEIVDRGPGVPETELERVFQPFYRTDDARSSNKSGVGLGLVAARSMVRAHGGDVQLRNSGAGLIAQVRLPLPREAA